MVANTWVIVTLIELDWETTNGAPRALALGPRLGRGGACSSAGRALGSHAHSTDSPASSRAAFIAMSRYLHWLVRPLANLRAQGQGPGDRNGSGGKALFVVARLVVKRAGKPQSFGSAKRGLRLRRAFQDYFLHQCEWLLKDRDTLVQRFEEIDLRSRIMNWKHAHFRQRREGQGDGAITLGAGRVDVDARPWLDLKHQREPIPGCDGRVA